MSYCRFSTDSYRCDLYCYEDVHGHFVTHVAARRHTLPDDVQDAPFDLLLSDPAEFTRQHYAFMDALKHAPREPIGLPHDGESFSDGDLETMRERVAELIQLGYRAPDWLLPTIDEELAGDEVAAYLAGEANAPPAW